MGDAEQRNCKNQDDLIAKAILDNFSKYVQKPSVTNEKNCCMQRSKTPLDKSTSCFSDWAPRSKCYSGLQSRTSVACSTGSHFMLGQPSTSNVNTSGLRCRQSNLFRGLHTDPSRFSMSAKALSSEPGFDGRGSTYCCQEQRSMSRVRGLGGTSQSKLGSDDCCFTESDGCDIGGTRNDSDFCCDLESDKGVFGASSFGGGFNGKQMQSKCDDSQRQDFCCTTQTGNDSPLDACLRMVRDSPRREANNDCCGMNGGDSISSSQPFRLNGQDSSFPTNSFRSGGADLCADPCQEDPCQEDPCQEDPCFGTGSSMRSNGAAFNSFSSGGQASKFGSDLCRPKVATDCCQLNGETSRFRADDCGLGGDGSLCCGLDSGRQTEGGSQFASRFGLNSAGQTNGGSQFGPNSFRQNGAFSSFPTATSATDNSDCSYDPCKPTRASTNFSSDPCETSCITCPDSFKSADKAQTCPTDMFKSNGDNCCFTDSFARADKTSNFASNSCRPNGECSDFCSDKTGDFGSNSFRPNGEGSQFISGSFRTADKSRDFGSNSCRPKDDCSDFCSDKTCDFASNSFRPNGEGSQFMPASFGPADKSRDFASNSCRPNDDCSDFCSDKTCDFASNSFRPNGEGSQFMPGSFGPADKSRDFASNSCRPNDECSDFCSDQTCDFASNSFRPNGEGSQFMAGSFGAADKSRDFASNSCRPNDECSDFCSDKTCDFASNSFRPNGEGAQFMAGSFGPADKSRDFASNSFRPNDECSDFCSDKTCDFASNSFRPNGEGAQFMPDSFGPADKSRDFASNSFRPNGDGSNFPVDPCGTSCNQNSGTMDCCVTNDMCDMKNEWEDPGCLLNICGIGLDEWFAVSPSLQKVVAKLAEKSVKKGSSEILKDLMRLKAANILPPDFKIPGEEQGAMPCGAQGAEATASQLKLTAERLVEHIVCRAAKIEAAGDENVDLSECDVYLEDVVKKISTMICQATGQQQQPQQKKQSFQQQQQQQQQQQGLESAPESQGVSKASSKNSSPSNSEASVVSGNSSANNSAVKSRRQLHDNICDTLMQNCFALLGVDPDTFDDLKDLNELKDSTDLRCAAKILSACGMTWPNVNNSQGGHDGTPTGTLSGSNSSLSNAALSNSALSNSSAPGSVESKNSAVSNSVVSKSVLSNSSVPKPAGSNSSVPKPAAPSPAGSNSVVSKSVLSNSAVSNTAVSNPSVSITANTASIDKVEKRSMKSQDSVANKGPESRLSGAHGSGHDSEKVQVERSSLVPESKSHSHRSVGSISVLEKVSSSALPPTTFLELQQPEQRQDEKNVRRDSLDAAILRMLEATLEDCTKLADNAELRWFVMEVVYSLYSTVRSRLEKILKQQAENAKPGSLSQPVGELLANADQEIREIVLPTVIEHIVWVLRQDAKQRGGKINYDAAKALAGEYVDTIVTNAVLKLETDGKMRRPYSKLFVVTSNDAKWKRKTYTGTAWNPPTQESTTNVIITPASAINLAPKPPQRVINTDLSPPPSTTSTELSQPSTTHTELSKPSTTRTELSKPSTTHTELSKPSTTHTELSKPSTTHTELSEPSTTHTFLTDPSATHTALSSPSSIQAELSPASSTHDPLTPASATNSALSQASATSAPLSEASTTSAPLSQGSTTSAPRSKGSSTSAPRSQGSSTRAISRALKSRNPFSSSKHDVPRV